MQQVQVQNAKAAAAAFAALYYNQFNYLLSASARAEEKTRGFAGERRRVKA
jgi:hypothetical protein